MKKSIFGIKLLTLAGAMAALSSCATSTAETTAEEPALKDVLADKFLIGGAINQWQVAGEDSMARQLAEKHFNTVVAENVMKSEVMTPKKGEYDFKLADEFVDWAAKNDMFTVGHCLVWHSQLAPWFAYDDNGKYVSADTLRQRMHDYITTVVTRYKGRVQGWDVVNEAILDDGSYRSTPFYDILGEEFIPLAFQYAHEADPEAELYINDFSMDKPGKRQRYVELVNDMKSKGLRVDAIGMQAHVGMDYPDFTEFEKSLEAFASTGSKVMLTELDMTALPTVTQGANVDANGEGNDELIPYPDGLPADVDSVWNSRMSTIMDICMRHSDAVSRVNFWGVEDGASWRNDWPVKGRKDYPLLFGRDYQMKPFMKEVVEKQQSSKS